MSAGLRVATLEPAEEPACENFVERHPQASFFHRPGWRRVLKRAYGYHTHYRVAWRGSEIAGVLPLTHVKTLLFGDALVSTGFCVYGGIAANDAAAADALAADAAALGTRLGVDHVELRQQQPLDNDWPVKDQLYVTFRKRLAADQDANLKAIPRKKRADVRKALRNDALRIETDVPVDDFFRIYGVSVRNHGTPVFPKRFFSAVKAEFGDAVEISAVAGPDGLLTGLVTYFFRDQVMPYYGGAVPAARKVHAYDLMYYRLMGRALERGATLFDFGRSKRGTGSFDFKTYWGFEPENLPYTYHLVKAKDLPDVNPNNPKYKLMIDIWRRLPVPIANLCGPFIARQLG